MKYYLLWTVKRKPPGDIWRFNVTRDDIPREEIQEHAEQIFMMYGAEDAMLCMEQVQCEGSEMSDIERFLDGLAELTRKTGYVIEGCGCCGSPVVRRISSPVGTYNVRDSAYGDADYVNLTFEELCEPSSQ